MDSTGRLYVLENGAGLAAPRVQRFTDAGAFDQAFAAGAYNSPTDLAVDPANDHVYIAAFNGDFSAKGILEFAADGSGVDIHASGTTGSGGINIAGIAVRSTTGLIYVASPFDPKAILVLDEVTPPTATIAPVTDVTPTGVVLHGSVNPQGPPDTKYRFEYSIDGSSWVSVPSAGGVSVGTGTSDVAVSQPVSGLDPNTEYRVRLVATKDFDAGSATSSEVTFTTATAPPLVRPLEAGSRTDTAAWLGGEVNPQNLPTTYFVEYTLATDTGYADSARVPVAAPGTDVGGGNTFVTVSQLATGLQPDTQYRFRVVAVNDAGSTPGPDRTFRTEEAMPPPPPGRGYEMVSPLDKNGADVDRNLPADVTSTSGAAGSGDVVAYAAQGQFAGIESGTPQGQYRSVRTDAGWATRGITPPLDPSPVSDAVAAAIWGLSSDLSHALVGTNVLLTPNASLLGGSWGIYLQDNTGLAPSYQLVNLPPAPLSQEPPPDPSGNSRKLRFSFSGATSDLRHIVFLSNNRQLTPEGPDTGLGLYQWSDGQIDFVSELPGGGAAPGPSLGARDFIGQYFPGDHAISEGGQRVYFTSNQAVYVHERGGTTTAVSVPERLGGPATPERAEFQAASAADGSRALFTSSIPLAPGAKAAGGDCQLTNGGSPDACHDDLYLWDANAPASQHLTDLTTADDDGGGVVGIAAVSDDLSRVYFVAGGVLATGAQKGQANLYVWTPDQGIRLVAILGSGDGAVWNTERDVRGQQYRDARVSADGDRLLFTSHARLTAANPGGHKQVYLYDLPTSRLVCVSCREDGGVRRETHGCSTRPTSARAQPSRRRERRIGCRGTCRRTASGSSSKPTQELVGSDKNGKADVYMWSASGLNLISSGSSSEESEFIDASESGDDVFFTTRDQLVGADVDHQVDVYDARVRGGLPEQEQPLPCIADNCQPPQLPRPVLPSLGSQIEAGDPPTFKRASFMVSRLSAKARRALAGGRRVSLTVRVNKRGRVVVRGTARIGKKTSTVMSAARRTRAAGKVRLSLRLSKAGRERLARAGALRVALRVRFSGVSEPTTLALTLERASKSGRGR